MGKASKRKGKDKAGAASRPATEPAETLAWWMSPMIGNLLIIGAAIALQFTIILLPLVGPAGAIAPHAFVNMMAWHAVLFLAMGLSGLSLWSKLKRRSQDQSPFPLLSTALLGVTVFFLLAHWMGLLRI